MLLDPFVICLFDPYLCPLGPYLCLLDSPGGLFSHVSIFGQLAVEIESVEVDPAFAVPEQVVRKVPRTQSSALSRVEHAPMWMLNLNLKVNLNLKSGWGKGSSFQKDHEEQQWRKA